MFTVAIVFVSQRHDGQRRGRTRVDCERPQVLVQLRGRRGAGVHVGREPRTRQHADCRLLVPEAGARQGPHHAGAARAARSRPLPPPDAPRRVRPSRNGSF